MGKNDGIKAGEINYETIEILHGQIRLLDSKGMVIKTFKGEEAQKIIERGISK